MVQTAVQLSSAFYFQENDQLQQDKCELVGIIETLKSDLKKVAKENSGLRFNNDQLKRWIGKRAHELGLGNYIHKRPTRGKRDNGHSERSVLRADPSLHSVSEPPALDVSEVQQPRSRSPLTSPGSPTQNPPSTRSPARAPTSPSPKELALASANLKSPPAPSSPRSLLRTPSAPQSPTPAEESVSMASLPKEADAPATTFDFQPVGIRTAYIRPQLHTPWLVEQPSIEKASKEGEAHMSMTVEAQQLPVVGLPEGQTMLSAEGQQVLYIPQNTYLVVQGDGGQQVLTTSSELPPVLVAPQQEVIAAAPEVGKEPVEVDSGVQLSHGDVGDKHEAAAEQDMDTSPTQVDVTTQGAAIAQPSMATAISSLLKLGCRIEMPGGLQLVSSTPASEETNVVIADHSYEAANVIAVPTATLEASNFVTVTTSS